MIWRRFALLIMQGAFLMDILLPRALYALGFIFLMTCLGAACAFMPSLKGGRNLSACISGFAGGVMLAASIWSLILPALARAELSAPVRALSAAVGIICGAGCIALPDMCSAGRGKSRLVDAVTLHNIPEGMAVGLACAGGSSSAALFALGIGIQNIPEGAAISLPLRQRGMSGRRAFLTGAASGAVEPVFGLLAFFFVRFLSPAMSWLMCFAAGAMLYVTASELLPEADSRGGMACFILGFTLMMVLDIAL